MATLRFPHLPVLYLFNIKKHTADICNSGWRMPIKLMYSLNTIH